MTNKKWTIKQLSLLVAILLLSIATVGGTLAYIFTSTGPVKNTFEPTEVTCEIVEPDWEDGDTTKSNVSVKNIGEPDAYIRATVVVTWQKGEDVLGEAPVEGEDYTIEFNTDAWAVGSDGYYYHKTSVASGSETGEFVKNCTVNKAAPVDDYTLHVEIIADAIQANPTDAVEEAWGVTVTVDDEGNATISKPAAEESN